MIQDCRRSRRNRNRSRSPNGNNPVEHGVRSSSFRASRRAAREVLCSSGARRASRMRRRPRLWLPQSHRPRAFRACRRLAGAGEFPRLRRFATNILDVLRVQRRIADRLEARIDDVSQPSQFAQPCAIVPRRFRSASANDVEARLASRSWRSPIGPIVRAGKMGTAYRRAEALLRHIGAFEAIGPNRFQQPRQSQ